MRWGVLVATLSCLAGCAKPADIKPSCTMNGLGRGDCSFTNMGQGEGAVCGKIVVTHDKSKRKVESAVFCSGRVPTTTTTKVEFSIPDVTEHCKPIEAWQTGWTHVCNFAFVPHVEGGTGGTTPKVPSTPSTPSTSTTPAATPLPETTSKYPGTPAGAKTLLIEFLKPGANCVGLTMSLKPTTADYASVFTTAEVAKQAETVYGGLWRAVPTMPVKPNAGQTELLMSSATTDELKAGTGQSREFPGGYKDVALHLRPGLTVYRWKFVKPGEKLGMAFDGLYFVNGHWVLMPKPWRVLRGK